jgi:hypothetical protein
VRSKVDALVNDGNKAFAKREDTKALESFGAAAKALPEAAADKANLLCNKAACYYQLKRCACADDLAEPGVSRRSAACSRTAARRRGLVTASSRLWGRPPLC